MATGRCLSFGRFRRFMSITACVLLLAMSTSTLSCYGKFPLTHAVYQFNGQVTNNKIIHSVVMWVFIIIPVYGIASLGDVVIFNLVEFWSGDTLNVSLATETQGGKVAFNTTPDGNAVLSISRSGQAAQEMKFTKVSATTFDVRNSAGTTIGHVIRGGNGDIMLTNAGGEVQRVISASDVARMRAR